MSQPPKDEYFQPEPLPVVGEATSLLIPEGAQGPQTMQRRLWFLLPLAGLSISMVWGGVLQGLIARQVPTFVAQESAQAATLGVVLTVGAISATVFTPFVGQLSDRTRSKFLGRRNIWMLGGAIIGALTLLLTALAPSTILLAIAWAVALIPLNGFQAAMAAVVPERVPVPVRARFTAMNGMAALVGVGIGAVLGNLVGITPAYIVLGVQLIVVGAVFAFFTRDVEPPKATPGETVVKSKFPGICTAPDFWLVFVGRFMAFLAYGLATGLTLYALRDYFKVGDGTLKAAQTLNGTLIVPMSTGLLIISAIAGGFLADKFRRMKPFVIGASLLFVPAALILMFVHSAPGAIAGLALLGFGFGSYISVDGALITMVLPRLEDAGRDLGVLNIANSGPQIIAPVVAGAVVSTLGFGWLYGLVIVVALLASVFVVLVKSVR